MTRQSHHIHPIAQMSFQNDWNHSTDSTNHQTSRRNAQTTRPTNCRNAQRCFQTGRNHSICDSTNHQTNYPTGPTNHQMSRRNAQTTRPTNCRNAQRCFQTNRNHSICDSTNHQTARMTHCCRTGFGRSSCCGDCSLL